MNILIYQSDNEVLIYQSDNMTMKILIYKYLSTRAGEDAQP